MDSLILYAIHSLRMHTLSAISLATFVCFYTLTCEQRRVMKCGRYQNQRFISIVNVNNALLLDLVKKSEALSSQPPSRRPSAPYNDSPYTTPSTTSSLFAFDHHHLHSFRSTGGAQSLWTDFEERYSCGRFTVAQFKSRNERRRTPFKFAIPR